MLTHLRVRNLKSIEDSGRIALRPLTFLMGPNSSGKSTVLQAILLARQTVDARDITNPLVLEGKYANIGSYNEFIHKHGRERRLALEFGFAPVVFPRFPGLERVDRVTLTAEFFYNRKTLQIYPTSVSYQTYPDVFRVMKTGSVKGVTSVEVYRGEERVARSKPGLGKFYDIGPPYVFPGVGRMRERELYYMLSYLPRHFEESLRNTFYVGPLRTSPQRTYVAAGETPQDVGLAGESTFSILWAAKWNRKLREKVFRPTSAWLSRFGIATTLELKRIGGSYFTAILIDPNLDIRANFADVGFGASQVLPAIVEALYAPDGATIIMEQPEIHLHPGGQAVLGDLFAEQALSGKQVIVETHSEHLVSHVLTRIADGRFPRDDLAVYYCCSEGGSTQVREIPVDEFGRLGEGLPPGFFEQGYVESKAHVEAIARRTGT